jgi:DNA-binding transcriptional LysR family regulator
MQFDPIRRKRASSADMRTAPSAITTPDAVLVRRAERALAELDDARAELRELSGVVAGLLTVGMTHTPGPLDIAGLLRRSLRGARGPSGPSRRPVSPCR